MQTTESPKAGERTHQTPQAAAADAERSGDFRTAARLYKQAGDIAGGHNHAAQMYAKAQECIAKTPDQPGAGDVQPHRENADQWSNEAKPVMRFNREVEIFTRDGVAISDEKAREHWDAIDSDWTQGAYKEMLGRVSHPSPR